MVEWVDILRDSGLSMRYTNEDEIMKIEAGKYYRTRDGRKVGPMRFDDYGGKYPFDENKGTMLWSDIGKCDEGQEKDLIAEWQDEPTMTNYNDGKWHGWMGEDMKPATIHDNSLVEYIWHHEAHDLYGRDKRNAGWDENDESPAWNNILKFRVIKEHKEPVKPREWFALVDKYDDIVEVGQYVDDLDQKRDDVKCIVVREVME